MNADGKADLVMKHAEFLPDQTNWSVRVYLNDGNANFTPMSGSPFTSPPITDLAVGNFLGDAAADVVITSSDGINHFFGNSGSLVYLFDGTVTHPAGTSLSSMTALDNGPTGYDTLAVISLGDSTGEALIITYEGGVSGVVDRQQFGELESVVRSSQKGFRR